MKNVGTGGVITFITSVFLCSKGGVMIKHERILKIEEEVNLYNKYYLLLTSPENIQYVCGVDLLFSSRPFYFLLEPNGKKHMFLNKLYSNQIFDSSNIEVHYYSDSENGIAQVSRIIPNRSYLAIDSTLNLDEYLWVRNSRNDLTVTLSNHVERARIIKDEDEINCLQKAVHYTDTAISQLKELIHLPSTELSISHQLITLFAQMDIHELNFNPIVAIGKNTVHPHYCSREIGINQGEPILIDLGCRVDGYRSDMTRMMICGDFFNEDIPKCFELLKEIQFGAIEMIKPGVAFAEVDEFVKKELKKYGLEKYYNHNLGHGIGLSAYEYPYIHSEAVGVFEENMVVTIGPGVYLENNFGLRIEDVVHVQANKAKSLSNLCTDWLKVEY